MLTLSWIVSPTYAAVKFSFAGLMLTAAVSGAACDGLIANPEAKASSIRQKAMITFFNEIPLAVDFKRAAIYSIENRVFSLYIRLRNWLGRCYCIVKSGFL
jgi:hypothetical protein